MNPGDTAVSNSNADASGSRAAWLSAGLLAAAVTASITRNILGWFVFYDISPAVGRMWWHGVSLAIDIAFIVAVYRLAIAPSRRVPALAVAVLAAVFSSGAALLGEVFSVRTAWPFAWIQLLSTVLLVAAWGLSRRRHSMWSMGLVPAFLLALGVGYLHRSWWLYQMSGDVGLLVVEPLLWWTTIGLGCLFCWGFDVIGRRRDAGSPPLSAGAPARYPGVPVARTDPMAIAALVVALVFAPVGVVLGHMSLSRMKRTGEDGKGLAIAALVIGYLGTALAVVYLIVIIGALVAFRSGA